jgi:hypothetical protein
MARTNKKQMYINSIEHSINFLTEIINSDKLFSWYHGEQITRSKARKWRADYQEELDKILTDKGYTPWKDNPEIYC